MKRIFTLLAALVTISTLQAQTPELVKDIRKSTYSSTSATVKESITVGNTVYFTAVSPDNPYLYNLWKTDGTVAGTQQITATISVNGLVNCNGMLYFSGYNGATGYELFKSDGTITGTLLVKDILPGIRGSEPSNITPGDGSTVYFTAGDKDAFRRDLWKTDGTTAGTIKLSNFDQNNLSYVAPNSLCFLNNTLFFGAGITSTTGAELWKSDGTIAGTVLLKEIYPGVNGSEPKYMTAFNGAVYFNANDGTTGYELWKSDGTANGTVLVKDLKTTTSNGISSDPKDFKVSGTTLFFSALDTPFANRTLWTTDGTAANTTNLKTYAPNALTNVNGTLYFNSGNKLVKSDGTEAGTVTLKTFGNGSLAGPYSITPTPLGTIYFVGNDGQNGDYEVWKSDGTEAGTKRVVDTWPGVNSSNPFALAMVGNQLVFAAKNNNSIFVLWSTDGSTTKALNTLTRSRDGGVKNLSIFKKKLYFSADDSTSGTEPWLSDGTTAGTTMLKDVVTGSAGSKPYNFVAAGGNLFFNADESLWKTDGTIAGTSSLSSPFFADNPTYITAVGNSVFFDAAGTQGSLLTGYELWKSNGTTGGTSQVKDIAPKSNESRPHHLVNLNGTVLFVADDNTNGDELWKSDGTDAGTVMVKDINTSGSAYIDTLIVMNNTVYFSALGALWKTNGTNAGTIALSQVSIVKNTYCPVGNTLFFVGYDPAYGYFLCKSDGTGAGTNIIKLFNQSKEEYKVHVKPVAFKNKVYFVATDSLKGTEIWSSDGTAAGTTVFADINKGTADAFPEQLYATADKLYFSAATDSFGKEVWVSDGSVSGTKRLTDLVAGAGSCNPHDFCTIGDSLFFIASTPATGDELWRLFTGCISAKVISNKATFCINDTVTFTAINVENYGRTPLVYNWVSANGTIINNHPSDSIFTVKFSQPGVKKVELVIQNGDNCSSSTLSKSLAVYDKPVADFICPSPTQCQKGNNFYFVYSGSGGGSSDTLKWNFGDQQMASGHDPDHTYKNAGAFEVSLQVIGNGNCASNIAKKTITVKPNSPTPTVLVGDSLSYKKATDSFSVPTIAGAIYKWNVTGGNIISGTGTEKIKVTWGTGSSGTVKVTQNTNTCESEAKQKVIILKEQTTKINELAPDQISIYPNPAYAADGLHIQLTNMASDKYTISLINTLGQLIINKQLIVNNSQELSSIDLAVPAGMYILQLSNSQHKVQQKIIVH